MFEVTGYWYRGGTSKCWLFKESDLPEDARSREGFARFLADAYDWQDADQIDGIGGATSVTSKAAMVKKLPDGADADIEYLFAQVGIGTDNVEYSSNCGNCSTGVGLFALTEGLVAPDASGHSVVRMLNANTNALLTARVDTPNGVVPDSGSATVPGVTAGGVPVQLGFVNPGGTSTGATLPTGNPVDTLTTGDLSVQASLVDAGAPCAFINAADLNLTGGDTIAAVDAHIDEFVALRRAAALAMGLVKESDPVSNATPKVGVVGAPVDYVDRKGNAIAASDYDIAVRMISMFAAHPSVGLTTAVAVAAAASQPGSIVESLSTKPADAGDTLRMGTASGIITASWLKDENGELTEVSLHRAARKIATAKIQIPERRS